MLNELKAIIQGCSFTAEWREQEAARNRENSMAVSLPPYVAVLRLEQLPLHLGQLSHGVPIVCVLVNFCGCVATLFRGRVCTAGLYAELLKFGGSL